MMISKERTPECSDTPFCVKRASTRMIILLGSVIALCTVVIAFASTGRFHVTTLREPAGSYVMMIDRFTGAAYICIAEQCRLVPYR